jgi:hypothetical protein
MTQRRPGIAKRCDVANKQPDNRFFRQFLEGCDGPQEDTLLQPTLRQRCCAPLPGVAVQVIT